jgi:hypothetical protein
MRYPGVRFVRRFSQNCERRLLVSSCLCAYPSGKSRLPLDVCFMKFYTYFWKICLENSRVIEKSDKNIWEFHMKTCVHLWYLAEFFVEWEVFQSCREQNTDFMFSNFPPHENRTVYEIMWKNMVEPDRPQMTAIIWRMCFACWISKATRTPSEYVILIAFARHQGLRERTLMLRVRTWPVLFLEYLNFCLWLKLINL